MTVSACFTYLLTWYTVYTTQSLTGAVFSFRFPLRFTSRYVPLLSRCPAVGVPRAQARQDSQRNPPFSAIATPCPARRGRWRGPWWSLVVRVGAARGAAAGSTAGAEACVGRWWWRRVSGESVGFGAAGWASVGSPPAAASEGEGLGVRSSSSIAPRAVLSSCVVAAWPCAFRPLTLRMTSFTARPPASAASRPGSS